MASTDGSTLKNCLRAAREAISKREFKEAIKQARAALKHDKRSYDAFLFIGKAAFSLEEFAQADVAYRKAVESNAEGLPAWQGLAELHGSTGDQEKLAEACRHLVDGWAAVGQADKASQYRRRLAQALLDLGRRDEARKLWEEVAKASKQGTEQRVEALCALADTEVVEHAEFIAREVQQRSSRQKKLAKAAAKSGFTGDAAPVDPDAIHREVEGESAPGLDKILGVIVADTAPSPQYAKYHVLDLQRAVAKLLQAQQGSFAEAEDAVLARSLRMIRAQSAAPEPFLLALALCEEDAASQLPAWKAFASRPVSAESSRREQGQLFLHLGQMFVHAFPSQGLGWIATAAGLYTKQQTRPTPDLDGVKAFCQLGLRLDSESPFGWHLLGEVQLAGASPSGALQCVQRGLEAVGTLRARIGLRLCRAELQLRILESCALIDSGKGDDAAKKLRDIETEAQVQLVGEDREEVLVAAVEGQARAVLASGTEGSGFSVARLALERVLGIQPSNDWAYSQLGLIALRSGDGTATLKEARTCFEEAIKLKPDDASYHFSLGQIYWRLGGELQRERQYAHAQFLEAARIDPGLAGAFTCLGRYYLEVRKDDLRARRCFQKAVQLDPNDECAGDTLADMMAASGQRRAEVGMCREACQRSPRAYWAWRRVGFLEAAAGRWQEALVSLQHALRGDASNAEAWEALALAYQRLGKFTAALKAYGQAEKLEKAEGKVPVFTLLQAGNIQLTLANFWKSREKFQAVLTHAPTHGAALAGLASSLLGQARYFKQQGAAQAAADLLLEAGSHAQTGVSLHGKTRPLWKLLADINLEIALVVPPKDIESLPSFENGVPAVANGVGGRSTRFLRQVDAAREVRVKAFKDSERAYRHAIHLNPADASGWADLSTCLKQRAEFSHPGREGKQKPLHWGWGAGKAKSGSAAGALLANPGLLLRTLAERLVMGALALKPTNAIHWATLGVVGQEPALQQHALIRALQINPKLSAAWVNLGQLYLAEGDFPLARAALDQARSCDPVLAVPWASMAYMEAEEARASKQKEEALSTARHAVQMGPVAEGQLGFGTLAAELGQLDRPEVYIALRKAVLQLPAVAAVHNLLGLACETRGLLQQAVDSFQRAREVLVAQGEGHGEQDDVAFNLARALATAGRYGEAVREYEKLQDGGSMLRESSAAAWRVYGLSLWHTGRREAGSAALVQALQLAPPPLPDTAPPKEHTAALCTLACMQFHGAGAEQALQTLKESVPECWQNTQVGLTALALAALARDNKMIAFAISHCRALFDHDLAPRTNRLLSIAHRLQGNSARALRHLRTALHTSPDSSALRAALSEALRTEDRPELARQVVQGSTRPVADRLVNPASVKDLGDCVREGAECLFALGWDPARAEQNERLFGDLQRWVKIDPTARGSRALLAFAAALRAQTTGSQSGRWESVRRLCRVAVEAERAEGDSASEYPDQGGTQEAAGSVVAHLELLDAEALARSRVRAEREAGRQKAMRVADVVRGTEKGLVHAQLARNAAAAGERRTAEAEFGAAIKSAGRIQDYLAYAAFQGSRGRFEEALQTLHDVEHAALGSGVRRRQWVTAVHVARADLLLKSGDSELAAAVASSATAEDPDNPVLLLLQGALLSLAADGGTGMEAAAQARRALSRAVHLWKSSNRPAPHAHYLLGQAELAAGGGRKVRDKWESSTRMACDQWPAMSQPAELLFQLAELAAASDKSGGLGLSHFGGQGPLLTAKQWTRRAVHVQPACSAFSANLKR